MKTFLSKNSGVIFEKKRLFFAWDDAADVTDEAIVLYDGKKEEQLDF